MSIRVPRLLGLALVAMLLTAAAAQARFPGATLKTVGSAPAGLHPTTPVSRGSGYLALGDSVTFGFQEAQVTPPPDYQDAASFRGYPEQLGTELHLRVTNLACPGETAASLVNQHAPSNGCEGAYRSSFPLHAKYSGSQLAAGVSYLRAHPGVRLVSLMIGANDLFRCQRVTQDGCTSASEQGAVFADVKHSVHTIVEQIRNRAHYGGQIVILNYYSLYYASPLINGYVQGLNAAQDSGAKPFDVRIANGYGEFLLASAKFGGSPCSAALLTNLGAGKCGVHPSYAGQALLAKAVAAATILR